MLSVCLISSNKTFKMKNYSLRFVQLGLSKVTNIRYQYDGKSTNFATDLELSSEQIVKANKGELDGLLQRQLNKMIQTKDEEAKFFIHKNKRIPTATEFKELITGIKKNDTLTIDIDGEIKQYFKTRTCKDSSKKQYESRLNNFKTFFDTVVYARNKTLTINEVVTELTLKLYGLHLIEKSIKNDKKITPISIFNFKMAAYMFFNFLTKKYNLPILQIDLKKPQQSQKWHINELDVNRLIEYIPTSEFEKDCVEIIKINKFVGLRISDMINIIPKNITFDSDSVTIKFIEEKNNTVRDVVIVDFEAIEILKERNKIAIISNNKTLWTFKEYKYFDYILKKVAAKVFKEETTELYKVDLDDKKSEFQSVKKSKAISSHAFRRFAVEQNVYKYGYDTARQLSGHKNIDFMIKHYSDYMSKENLKDKLKGTGKK